MNLSDIISFVGKRIVNIETGVDFCTITVVGSSGFESSFTVVSCANHEILFVTPEELESLK